jgi:hypothetical protein
MSDYTSETLRARGILWGRAGHDLVEDICVAHADAWQEQVRELKGEILNWRAEHYADMLASGKLDYAEFDKRIHALNAERSALPPASEEAREGADRPLVRYAEERLRQEYRDEEDRAGGLGVTYQTWRERRLMAYASEPPGEEPV